MTYSEQRVVAVSRSVFFGVIADVEKYEAFLPWCTRSRVLHRFGPLKFDAELCVGFRGMYQESYVSRVVLEPDTRVKVTMHSSPLLKTLSNDWHLSDVPGEPSKTLVKFDVEFQFRSQLHAVAAKLFFQEVHSRMLAAFLERAAQLQKSGTASSLKS